MDYYKELLTEKQKYIMELYFNEDLSLSEISELTNTSRQAIFDIIKRCNKLLTEYESKLKLVEKNNEIKISKELILQKIDRLQESIDKKEFIDLIQEIKNNIVESI
jgi:predicted DNA-binding protein YlxM (UPF0122 family)